MGGRGGISRAAFVPSGSYSSGRAMLEGSRR